MSFPIDASPAPSHRPGSEVSAPATVVASVLDYDILCVIFDGNRGPQGILTNSDLVRCALISRAFSEAALRALWKNPPTLRPLWHVLAPPNLKFPKKDDETEEYFDKIESAGLHKDAAYWRRLVGYARHIQNINAEHLFDQRDANLLELVLHENGTGRPLFPSLRSLQLSPTICTIPSFCRLFASTVRNLKCSIKFKDEPEDNEELRVLHNIANAVGSLQGTSSQLSWIYVEKRAREGLLASKAELELLHNISGLRSLQNITLRLSAIPASAVVSLAAIPTLNFLELGAVVVDLAVPAHKVTSPALRVLRLQGRSTGVLATLRGLYAPVLRTLNVNVTDFTSTPHIFSSVAEAVAKSVNPDVFCHFSAILGDWTVPNALERLTRILRPLAPLRALRDIKLSSQSPFLPFMASDAEFADILGNARWSQLEEFVMDGLLLGDGESRPSTSILCHFRASCPNLRTLVLPSLRVEVNQPQPLVDAALSSSPHHPLRLLRLIGGEEVRASLDSYVRSIFPTLGLSRDERYRGLGLAWQGPVPRSLEEDTKVCDRGGGTFHRHAIANDFRSFYDMVNSRRKLDRGARAAMIRASKQ